MSKGFEDTDWSRWLLGACSSGEALRHGVERNAEQVSGLRREIERLRRIEAAYIDAFGEFSPEQHELIKAAVLDAGI